MFTLLVHDDAKADLEQLWQESPQAAAVITTLLQEIEGSQDTLDRLTQHDFGAYRTGTGRIHVSKWWEQWIEGKDLWRLKVWELEDIGLHYRVIYAFIPNERHYHVLSVAPRDFNYERNHPITIRILRAYDTLRLGR